MRETLKRACAGALLLLALSTAAWGQSPDPDAARLVTEDRGGRGPGASGAAGPPYHAGMDDEERARVQDWFLSHTSPSRRC